MIGECLVVLACLKDVGCSETSSAYYKTHPEMRVIIEHNERRVKEFVGPVLIESSAPFIFITLGGTGNFKLSRDFSLRVDKNRDSMLIYSKGF